MNIRTSLPVLLIISLIFSSCAQKEAGNTSDQIPKVVTADIQEGIEKHIEEQSSANDGYFNLALGEKDLNLKLVRVHVEYLANLGPRSHFACVDLADIDGEVYDVDFFLKGDPGAMTVTKTTVHKRNGKPYYTWAQKKDRTWYRVPVEDADAALLGVIEGKDTFEFYYRVELPEITEDARMWVPVAQTNAFQKVDIQSIIVPGKSKNLEEKAYSNKVLFVELGPEDSGKELEIVYKVERLEKGAYEEPHTDPSKYLAAEKFVPITDEFREIAKEVVTDKKSGLVRARALYDHVIDRMSYKKYGDGWGEGNAEYACDARSGNCTDFHSYFIALARSVNIPARFAIGAPIPSARDDGGISGYHCWAEFYAEGKWWPVDISEGDKYTSLATYYFGHHPANRIEFSQGRDLVVDPGPASGPINYFAYPVLEIAGIPAKAKVTFSFKRT